MIDPVRQEVIALAHTVVVKVGTNVLTRPDGALEPARVQALADQLHRLRATGRKVALVSSGAIGAGMGRLGLGKRPTDLRQLQACAAVGQSFLMRAYEDCLARHNIPTAQLLLTAGDFDSRARYLNARNTILTLFEWGCLPIINENDTVSVAEIRFGDNDHLAALVTNLLQAPLLVLLTVVDGLYTADPKSDPGASWWARSRSSTPTCWTGRGRAAAPGVGGDAKQAARRPAGDVGRRIGHHGQRRAGRRAGRHLPGRAGGDAVFAARHDDAGVETLAGLRGPAARPVRGGRRRPAGGADAGPQPAADRRGAGGGRVPQGRRGGAVRCRRAWSSPAG